MSYSLETRQYLLQRFGSLKENPAFEEAYQRMSNFAVSEEHPTRDELLQYAVDLETTSHIIRGIVKDCDEVEEEMEWRRYADILPESMKQQMEEISAKLNNELKIHLLNRPVTKSTPTIIRNLVEQWLSAARSDFEDKDIDFLRKRIFAGMVIDGLSFKNFEKKMADR